MCWWMMPSCNLYSVKLSARVQLNKCRRYSRSIAHDCATNVAHQIYCGEANKSLCCTPLSLFTELGMPPAIPLNELCYDSHPTQDKPLPSHASFTAIQPLPGNTLQHVKSDHRLSSTCRYCCEPNVEPLLGRDHCNLVLRSSPNKA